MGNNVIKSILRRFLACLLIIHLLAACGQKGPLFLPEQKPPEQKRR